MPLRSLRLPARVALEAIARDEHALLPVYGVASFYAIPAAPGQVRHRLCMGSLHCRRSPGGEAFTGAESRWWHHPDASSPCRPSLLGGCALRRCAIGADDTHAHGPPSAPVVAGSAKWSRSGS